MGQLFLEGWGAEGEPRAGPCQPGLSPAVPRPQEPETPRCHGLFQHPFCFQPFEWFLNLLNREGKHCLLNVFVPQIQLLQSSQTCNMSRQKREWPLRQQTGPLSFPEGKKENSKPWRRWQVPSAVISFYTMVEWYAKGLQSLSKKPLTEIYSTSINKLWKQVFKCMVIHENKRKQLLLGKHSNKK